MNRILQFPLVRMIAAVLFAGAGIAMGQMVLGLLRSAIPVTDTGAANLLALILVAPAVFFAYRLYAQLVERRSPAELGGARAGREFALGSLIGVGLYGIVIAVLWLAGSYRVTETAFALLPLAGALAGALVSAFAQEVIFRGAIYRITEEWLGTWWAVAASAVLFGLIHLTNADATLFSAAAVALQAGVLLAAAYALTHRLWMPVGLHMAWDFANDGLFGVGVAGQTGTRLPGLLHASLSGPDLLTGGALGVEASILSLVFVFLAGALLLWKARQKGAFKSRKSASTAIGIQPAHPG